jgi:hypothetical protein
MALHIRYIRSATYYWRDYLNYKSSELLSLVGYNNRLSVHAFMLTDKPGRESIRSKAV